MGVGVGSFTSSPSPVDVSTGLSGFFVGSGVGVGVAVASVGSFSVSEVDGSVGFGVGVGVGVFPVTGSFVVSAGSEEVPDSFPEVSEDLEDPEVEEDVSLFFVVPSELSPGVSEEPVEEAGSEGSFSVSERSADPSLVPSEEESEEPEAFEVPDEAAELSEEAGSLEELHPRRIRNSETPSMIAAIATAIMMLRLFLLIFMLLSLHQSRLHL